MKCKSIIFFISFFLFFHSELYSQKVESQIDSLLVLSDSTLYSNIKQSLAYAKKANNLAKNIDNKKLKANTYLYVAVRLGELTQYEEAIGAAKAGLKIPFDDIHLKIELKEAKAIFNSYLGLNSYAIQEYQKLLSLIEEYNEGDDKELFRKTKTNIYQNLSASYYNNYQTDSAFIMINKAIDILQKVPEKGKPINGSEVYLTKASYLLGTEKQSDSIRFYANLSLQEAKKRKDDNFWDQYRHLGIYHFYEKNYDQALKFLHKSLEDMDKAGLPDDFLSKYDIYLTLSDTYEQKGDVKKQILYLKKSDSILKNDTFKNKQEVSEVADQQLKEKESTFLDKIKQYQYYIYAIVILLGSTLIISYIVFKKKIFESKKEVNQKNVLLHQTEKKSEELQNKVEDDRFEKLIDSAKKNKASFLILFEQQYPDFIQTLRSMNAKVTNSELSFLAYAFLNFSTKEIAYYTNVTEKAVQTRKYRIRKKYEIPTEVDFNGWVKSLVK